MGRVLAFTDELLLIRLSLLDMVLKSHKKTKQGVQTGEGATWLKCVLEI